MIENCFGCFKDTKPEDFAEHYGIGRGCFCKSCKAELDHWNQPEQRAAFAEESDRQAELHHAARQRQEMSTDERQREFMRMAD